MRLSQNGYDKKKDCDLKIFDEHNYSKRAREFGSSLIALTSSLRAMNAHRSSIPILNVYEYSG